MNLQINSNVEAIQISGIRQFFNKVQQVPDAVQLTIGQPDFPTPDHIKKAAVRAIGENKTSYTANAGTLGLRKAACNWVQSHYSLTYEPDSEVIVTAGASQAIDTAMRTILQPGDEVILPAPVYPAYEPIIRQCGAVPVYADTRETGFKLTPAHVEALYSPRTKAVLLPYPSNPTGAVLTKAEMEGLYNVLLNKECYVVTDEIYSELTFDGSHISIGTYPGMKQKTIVINGLSKSHSMTGWRIGFLFAPSHLAKHLLKVHQYTISCASSISQAAAEQALTEGLEDPEAMREVYMERRDYLFDRLQAMGMEVQKPGGAFYLFPSIQKSGLNADEFAERLLFEERAAVVPGSAFSAYGDTFIRLSSAYAMPELREAANRLERFWSKVTADR
ncbi:aminotransferase A [Alkalicoccus luteus]|uniref:Aminotransferase n=1 Tax=Alkalicoccus luteus TaxID=1237094 RepID=A0A969PQV2_9BACI|nr:aminotransferase A [Alkalicoccus luteus]NJP37334.1 aminotransferase A [Alkalicoccus luteus]